MGIEEYPRYDYVVIGAGSAGCVLANRLSADPGVRVALVEAGGKDWSPWIHVPVGYVKTMVSPAVNWMFETEPEAATGNRRIPVPRGKVLGGSSSINGMLYVRGQALDYDIWAQLGNRGWSYQEVLPYFKRSENREGPRSDFHGTGGPLNVADMRETDPLLDAVIASAEASGYPVNDDYNGATQEGFGYFQVTQRDGKRHSSAKAFLAPVRSRRNLDVITRAQATRVVLEGKRAVAVEIARGEGRDRGGLRAEREVILAAGTVQSPQLLELSGIGDPDRLRPLGIEVQHALPGVGENYQDHYIVRVVFRVRDMVTLNQRLRGPALMKEVLRYLLGHQGALTLTAGIAFGFVRSRPELETPDIQYHIAHASFKDAAKRILDPFPGLTMGPCQLRPASRGSIHARSSDPLEAPAIRPNFLAERVDRETLLAGVRIARQVGGAGPLARLVVNEEIPGPGVESDDEILAFVRETGATVYHPVGTCKMGSDPLAVVDPELRVHGIAGLRVVDASIMPTLTSGNTNAPAIMIAEKGADLIKAAARDTA